MNSNKCSISNRINFFANGRYNLVSYYVWKQRVITDFLRYSFIVVTTP